MTHRSVVRELGAFGWEWLVAALMALVATGCFGRSDLADPDQPPDAGGAGGLSGAGGSGAVGGTGGTSGSGGGGGTGGTGGTGARRCNPDNCQGCCDATDTCQRGTLPAACGVQGVACMDCASIELGCVEGACQGAPPACSPSTCPEGCCDAAGVCRAGAEVDRCGRGGERCADCGAKAMGCVAGECRGAPPACGPGNCSGCCSASGQCVAGTAGAACGTGGERCASCGSGRQCVQPGNYCAFVPSCGPLTCPTGCCDAQGRCRDGRADAACGTAGNACSDCAGAGKSCAPQGFCYAGAHCGPDNCAGCCTTTGRCVEGSSNASCGQYGALCDNCGASGKTCRANVCSDGSVCPAAYPGCLPGARTTPPIASAACHERDLTALGSACRGDASGGECGAWFEELLLSNPGCYDCVAQFSSDQAYVKCLAPYLSASCNEALTCAVDCSSATCGRCDASGVEACQSGAFEAGGACRGFVSGYYCASAALRGPAAFCDSSTLGGDVGAWLERVARHYCGR